MSGAPANFHNRIARINSGSQWDCEGVVTQKVRGKKKGPSNNNPVSLVFGVVLGALLVVAARAVRFHFLPDTFMGGVANLQEALLIDGMMAGSVAVLMALVRRWRSFMGLLGRAGGLAVGALAMHLVVHVNPEPFAIAFSETWVRDVISTTQPTSLLNVNLPVTSLNVAMSKL